MRENEIIRTYFEMGLPLVPIKANDKTPLISEWQKNPIKTYDEFEPFLLSNANVGLLTGKASGIIVIDMDVDKNTGAAIGLKSVTSKQTDLDCILPETVTMISQSGGLHYWYKYPTGYNYIKGKVKILDHVDIRADGNQVVIPPSVGIKGSYEWVKSPFEIELAELPIEWLEFILKECDAEPDQPSNKIIKFKKGKLKVPDVIGENERNVMLFKYACSMFGQCEEDSDVWHKLSEKNQSGTYEPLDDRELSTIYSSARKTHYNNKAKKVEEQTGKKVDDSYSLPRWLMLVQRSKDEVLKINELLFAQDFVKEQQLSYINYSFYNHNGLILEYEIRNMILNMISPYFNIGLPTKISVLVDTIKDYAYKNLPEIKPNVICLKNATLVATKKGVTQIKPVFTLNKLTFDYDPDAKCPRWEKFIEELLPEQAIPILQEYLGYLFIPTTLAQKAMFIVGNGGEGKSRIGVLLSRMLGRSLSSGAFHEFQTNRFITASLENRLVFLDDDIQLTAIKDTQMFKKLVTMESPVSIEKKGKDFYDIQPYARFLCFGNGAISSFYDHSDGFYRRLLILKVNQLMDDREDDPLLIEKLSEEMSGIFNWCLTGLIRLLNQNYKFSNKAYRDSLVDAVRDEADNINIYFNHSDYCQLAKNNPELDPSQLTRSDEQFTCTRKELYQSYCEWCDNNAYHPFGRTTFIKYVSSNLDKLQIRESGNIVRENKRNRGYIGVGCFCTFGLQTFRVRND